MQILIWGDNMKRQIGICIFLASIILISIFSFVIVLDNEHKNTENTEKNTQLQEERANEQVEQLQEPKEYKYYIKNDMGRISVYETKEDTLFMETAIESEYLPVEIQEKLIDGIYFENESDLFDFLESYSS